MNQNFPLKIYSTRYIKKINWKLKSKDLEKKNISLNFFPEFLQKFTSKIQNDVQFLCKIRGAENILLNLTYYKYG